MDRPEVSGGCAGRFLLRTRSGNRANLNPVPSGLFRVIQRLVGHFQDSGQVIVLGIGSRQPDADCDRQFPGRLCTLCLLTAVCGFFLYR